MPTVLETCRVRLLGLAAIGLLAVAGCRGTPLAQTGRSFDDSRTSLKAGTVSRADAARVDDHRREALAGDPRSRTLLGLMYQTGQGVPRNEVKAAHWFQLAADQDDCAGQYHLGLLYLQGAGVPVDLDRATEWLRRAADHQLAVQQSSFESLYDGILALAHSLGGAFEASPAPRAESAGSRPITSVASLYERGRAHLEGQGVPADPAHAVRLFRMAAREGHAGAQLELGLAYAVGRGARLDPVRAHQWLNIASASGSPSAREELSRLEADLSPAQIAEAEYLALEWMNGRDRP